MVGPSIYIYMYITITIYIYIHMHVYIYIYVDIDIDMDMYIYIYTKCSVSRRNLQLGGCMPLSVSSMSEFPPWTKKQTIIPGI